MLLSLNPSANPYTMESTTSWNLSLKIFFRFFFIYLILYTFPFPITVFEFAYPEALTTQMWNEPVVWLGKNLFGLEIDTLPNGSGDTTWNYVQVLLFGMISVAGTLIWSIFDRRRSDYTTLYFWLTVLVRYYLAGTMISYGMFKIIQTQFPFPHLARLIEPYGDSSPMGLLWTFMGYSTAYNFFTGMAEALGGFLLFFRKTRLLGALICIAVMSNVVMLNFAYDVPVKLFSLHLLFMAIFLMVPDINRLIDFFILNKQPKVLEIAPLWKGTKWFYPYAIVKTLFAGYVVVSLIVAVSGYHKQLSAASNPELYGIYDVEKYAINGDTLPALLNDTKRWKRILVDRNGWGSVEYMDQAKIYYRFSSDTLNGKVSILSQDSSAVYTFAHKRMRDRFYWQGGNKSDSIFLLVRRKDPSEFLLVNRGFSWINEYPFNR